MRISCLPPFTTIVMLFVFGNAKAQTSIDELVTEMGKVFRERNPQSMSSRISKEKQGDRSIRWSKLIQMGGNLAESPKYTLLSLIPSSDWRKIGVEKPPISSSNFNLNALKGFQSILGYSVTTTAKPIVSFKRIFENTMGASPLSRIAGNLLDTVSSQKLGYQYERPSEMLFKKTWYGEALGTILGETAGKNVENEEIRRSPSSGRNRNFGLSNILSPSPFSSSAPSLQPDFLYSTTTEVPPLVNPLDLFSRPLQNFIGIQKRNKRVLETGDEAFDRLVIHENEGGGLLSNEWNKKGLQWTDGNLRLVNMKGRDLLGSEVAVHDRSIDIPVQSWIDLASGLLTSPSE